MGVTGVAIPMSEWPRKNNFRKALTLTHGVGILVLRSNTPGYWGH